MWTVERALEYGYMFIQRHHHVPRAEDLRQKQGGLTQRTVRTLFGSVRNYQEELEEYVVYVTQHKRNHSQRECLRCGRVFTPKEEHYHICSVCKKTERADDAGEWMGHGPVREDYYEDDV